VVRVAIVVADSAACVDKIIAVQKIYDLMRGFANYQL